MASGASRFSSRKCVAPASSQRPPGETGSRSCVVLAPMRLRTDGVMTEAAAIQFAPDGVDAVLALAGGEPLSRLLDAVRRGGRVAFPNGVEPAPRKRRGLSVKSYDGTPGVREFARLGRATEAARLCGVVSAEPGSEGSPTARAASRARQDRAAYSRSPDRRLDTSIQPSQPRPVRIPSIGSRSRPPASFGQSP